MLAVSPVAARVATPATALAAVQAITRSHRPRELLIKFRPNAQQSLRDVVVRAFVKNSKKLKGRSGTEKITIKDNLDLANTLFNVRQLNLVVEWAEPNYIVKKSAQSPQPDDPQFPLQWALLNSGQNGGVTGADIGAPAGWATTTGSRQTIIAVIDTGVDLTHPDLRENLWKNTFESTGPALQDDDGNGYVDDVRGWNFVSDSNDVTDDQGHGTQMAGLIAAEGNNAAGIAGVMWQAAIMSLKALDASASGTIANVVEAIDYAAENHASVINCSFGGGGYSNAMYEAIERAAIAGALVVAAAGNNGVGLAQSPHYPAVYTVGNLMSVAATTNSDSLATFSN